MPGFVKVLHVILEAKGYLTMKTNTHTSTMTGQKITMKYALIFVGMVALGAHLSDASFADEQSHWQIDTTVNVDELNQDLVRTEPTVDVAVYYPSNLDEKFQQMVSVHGIMKEFKEAKRIFDEAGVQLKLLWVKRGYVDPQYFSIMSSYAGRETPGDGFVNMYIDSERKPTQLTQEAATAFDSIIELDSRNADTIYLIPFQGVYMSYWETTDNGRNWAPRLVRTRALSFPSYSYGGTIPNRLRGVITLSGHDDENYSMIAHELGHKLINVSHEYKDQAPQHEVEADGGLMLYGDGTDIPSGESGRWHRERLHMSPYVYRYTEDGVRVQNPDYVGHGFYYDTLYGDKVVKFEGVRLLGKD